MLRPILNRVRCKKCDSIIESRTTHDYRQCACRSISVDGGREYQKVSWPDGEKEEDYIDYSYSVYEKN